MLTIFILLSTFLALMWIFLWKSPPFLHVADEDGFNLYREVKNWTLQFCFCERQIYENWWKREGSVSYTGQWAGDIRVIVKISDGASEHWLCTRVQPVRQHVAFTLKRKEISFTPSSCFYCVALPTLRYNPNIYLAFPPKSFEKWEGSVSGNTHFRNIQSEWTCNLYSPRLDCSQKLFARISQVN